jgi:RNA polymerase sigma factor (sigma-70 family)
MTTERRGVALRSFQVLFQEGTVGGLTDGQLLRRFAERHGESAELAFTVLIERHGPMVLRTCRAILRDAHEAHDAFQATFLVLTRRARVLWVRDSLGPWLHQVACRTALCARSAIHRRRRHEGEAAKLATWTVNEEPGDDLAEIIHQELNRLPETNRAAIVLCLIEGLTHEEAARGLGWPVGTVQSRLARGRERLRRRLALRGLAPSAGALALALSASNVSAAELSRITDYAIRLASRRIESAVSVPLSITRLVQEVLRTMLMTKLRITVAALSIAIAVLGVAAFAQSPSPSQSRGATAAPKARIDPPAAPAPPAKSSEPLQKAEIAAIEIYATDRAETEALKARLEVAEGQRVATLALLKKYHFGIPDDLGREPTDEETRIASQYQELESAYEKILTAIAEFRAELLKAEITTTLLEQRLPISIRETSVSASHEQRLSDVEHKLDRILKTFEDRESAPAGNPE